MFEWWRIKVQSCSFAHLWSGLLVLMDSLLWYKTCFWVLVEVKITQHSLENASGGSVCRVTSYNFSIILRWNVCMFGSAHTLSHKYLRWMRALFICLDGQLHIVHWLYLSSDRSQNYMEPFQWWLSVHVNSSFHISCSKWSSGTHSLLSHMCVTCRLQLKGMSAEQGSNLARLHTSWHWTHLYCIPLHESCPLGQGF